MKAIYFLFIIKLLFLSSYSKAPVYTQVTYLYDIKRGEVDGVGHRSFQYYKQHFEKQLKTDCNMIIYGDQQMAQLVWQHREQHNTVFVLKPLSQFKKYWFSPLIQKVRLEKVQNSSFINKDHIAFTLEYYSVLRMAKLFIMYESLKYDKFDTDIIIWVDAGFTHHFPDQINVFNPQNTLKQFYQFLQPQWLLLGYGEQSTILDGYALGELRYINRKLKPSQMMLSEHQGGYIEIVKDIKSAFENFLKITLEHGDLSAKEAIMSMMQVKFPYLIPITTMFYLGQMIQKIGIYENINKKPSHSREFGCKLSPQNILINFDYPISKQNAGQLKNAKNQKGKLQIGQELTKPIRSIDSQYNLSAKLSSSQIYYYLHLIIIALLIFSYGYIQSMKSNYKQTISLTRKRQTI